MGDENIQRCCYRAMRLFGASLLFLLSLPLARADVVKDWTLIALHTAISSPQPTVPAARAMAMVHVAMFETMNFIEDRYIPRFIVRPPQPVGISSAAAGAAAAHFVLVRLYPEQEPVLDAWLQRSIAAIPDTDKTSALVTGRALAADIYAIWASNPGASGNNSGASYVPWYWIVAQFVEAEGLRTLESARVHAIVSMALGELHRTKQQLCTPCASGAAVQTILESASGSTSAAGTTRTGGVAKGSASLLPLLVEYGRGLSSGESDGVGPLQSSIEASERLGRTIGLRAAASYQPAGRPQDGFPREKP